MPKVCRKYSIKRKERKMILNEFSSNLGIDINEKFGSKSQISVIEISNHRIYLVNGDPIIAKSGDDLFPTLLFEKHILTMPKAVVDMGAIPFICNGADIMAAGIVEIQGQFKKESLIVIVDERNRKPYY